MKFGAIIMAALAVVWNLLSCTAKDPGKMTVSDFSPEELTFTGYCMTTSVEENYIRYYKGEIAGETAQRLYEIVCGQYSQPKMSGGNYLSGTPYLTITAPGGQEYTCSYTWDSEKTVYDDYGQPGTEPVGTCFAITGTKSAKFQPTSAETKNEFERIIEDYLTENYKPYRETLFNKGAKTDHIVFVRRYTNYACGKTDNGSFVDVWGNMYRFDFSDRDFQNDEELFEALWQVYCDTAPVKLAVCDSDKLFDILLNEIPQINENASMSSQSSGGADMGQRTLYAVDLDGNLIELRSEGDWNSFLEDPAAKRLCDFYDSI